MFIELFHILWLKTIQKNMIFFEVRGSSSLVIRIETPELYSILKIWIQIRIEWMQIRNSEF
jgi:hypothetical protein